MDCKSIDYRNIPVQLDIISGIIRLDMDSNSCFRDLDSYVRSDQGVAALLLRVVNSVLYSRGKQISTIPMAISVLGFNVVRALSMLAFSRSLFAQTQSRLFHEHIWQHSLLTALAGQSICQDLGDGKDKDDAFIAGLMHDIGKVLLFTHDEERYGEVFRLILEQRYASVAAERQVFGCDHCQVGQEAVRQWKLPERFTDYMGTDLNIPRTEYAGSPVQLSLAVANCLIDNIGIGAQAEPDIGIRRAALKAFDLDDGLIESWLSEEFVSGLMNNETYQLCVNL
jgi:putative nucleotidyltransferase with HDIG domain